MKNICSHKAVKAMALLFLSFAFSASAETWWVAEDGNDDATGSELAPFASLSRALERASAEGRDVIRIKDGTYVSTGAVLVDKPVEIIGNDADRSKVTIDGEQSAVDLAGDVRIRGRIDLGCYESRGRGLVVLIY